MIYCLILIVILLIILAMQNSSSYRMAVAMEQIAASARELSIAADTHDIAKKIAGIHEAVLAIRLQTQPDDEEEPPFA